MIKGRVIAIGDVHGCPAELTELLNLIAPAEDDYVLFLGDLLNRGPDSHAVIKIARKLRAGALFGNHELRLLKARQTGKIGQLRPHDHLTLRQLTKKDWKYIESMRLHHFLPEDDVVFVHGGFLPNVAWQTQPASVVTQIQVVGPGNKPMKRANSVNHPVWADLWEGPPFVVYGHTPRPEVYERPSSIGIDTGCVLGGHLTAYILPEKKIVQVKARERYF